MTTPCRPDPTRPRPDAVERTADYLHRIATCPCPPQWRQPGGLCGGCGRDGFGVAGVQTNQIEIERKEADR